MLKIAIIMGSTRPNRVSPQVAQWVHHHASLRNDVQFELIDLKDFDLPLFDEPMPPLMDQYSKPHTLKWAAKMAQFDAYIFVTPEYNHDTSAALKNALDFLYKEWNNKSCGFVGYGALGGARAIEHLRSIVSELMLADVKAAVYLSLFTDFENFSQFKPAERHMPNLNIMIDQVISWGSTLKAVRK